MEGFAVAGCGRLARGVVRVSDSVSAGEGVLVAWSKGVGGGKVGGVRALAR